MALGKEAALSEIIKSPKRFPMTIITWNIKGLGIPKKRCSVKEVLKKYKADVVMIQETRKFSIGKKSIQSCRGGRNKDWVFSPSEGAAGEC